MERSVSAFENYAEYDKKKHHKGCYNRYIMLNMENFHPKLFAIDQL